MRGGVAGVFAALFGFGFNRALDTLLGLKVTHLLFRVGTVTRHTPLTRRATIRLAADVLAVSVGFTESAYVIIRVTRRRFRIRTLRTLQTLDAFPRALFAHRCFAAAHQSAWIGKILVALFVAGSLWTIVDIILKQIAYAACETYRQTYAQ